MPPRPVALVPVHRQGACTLRLGQTKLRCSEARSTGLLTVPPGTCIGSRGASRRSRPRTRFLRWLSHKAAGDQRGGAALSGAFVPGAQGSGGVGPEGLFRPSRWLSGGGGAW